MPRACAVMAMVVVCALGGGVAGAAEGGQAPSRELQVSDSRLQFYGFMRLDVVYDDSRPDSFQSPLFIQSEREGAEDQENFTMYPRLSRLGMNFAGPAIAALSDARVGGKLEIDFQNGGRESRAIPRFRHVYLTVAWPSTTLLFGQTWDVISPLIPSVNADTLMWNAGNPGDRRPQVRVTFQPKGDKLQWSVAGAAGLTNAVDAQDLDNDGVRDGEAAGVPNLQGRVGVSYPAGTRRVSFGVSGHVGRMKVGTAIADETSFGSSSIGADYEVPLGRRGVVRGEVWTGRNLSDVRGGIGQAIARASGEEIRSTGGWTEVGGDLTSVYSLFVGYTIDAPDENDLAAGARRRNDAWFVVNRWNARPMVFGIDYLRWTTEYVGLPDGVDNRVNAYVVYSF